MKYTRTERAKKTSWLFGLYNRPFKYVRIKGSDGAQAGYPIPNNTNCIKTLGTAGADMGRKEVVPG